VEDYSGLFRHKAYCPLSLLSGAAKSECDLKRIRTFEAFENAVYRAEERFQELLLDLASQGPPQWYQAYVESLYAMVCQIRREVETHQFSAKVARHSLGRAATENAELAEHYPDLVDLCVNIGLYYENILP